MNIANIETPLGPVLCVASEEELCVLEFVSDDAPERQLARIQKRLNAPLLEGATSVTRMLDEQLHAYFSGSLRRFELRLAPRGTSFQTRVWEALGTIPYGQTRSYHEQALRLGSAASVRAVARANGDNPIAILIPCHRVVAADGKLTGYAGGLWRKQRLLDLERGQGHLALT